MNSQNHIQTAMMAVATIVGVIAGAMGGDIIRKRTEQSARIRDKLAQLDRDMAEQLADALDWANGEIRREMRHIDALKARVAQLELELQAQRPASSASQCDACSPS